MPKSIMEGKSSDSGMGIKARLQTRLANKATQLMRKHHSTLIYSNWARVGYDGGFVDEKGAEALKFMTSTSIELTPGAQIIIEKDDDKMKIGKKVRVKIVKHKVASPFRTCIELRWL